MIGVSQASNVVVYTTNTTPYSDECLLALIRARAYELFEMRSRDNGHALDDWIQAEREINITWGSSHVGRRAGDQDSGGGACKPSLSELCHSPGSNERFSSRRLRLYKQLRYEEDYGYLRDRAAHSDPFDAIKFVPLGAEGDRYLSLGGEIRQRYEYFHNPVWGKRRKTPTGIGCSATCCIPTFILEIEFASLARSRAESNWAVRVVRVAQTKTNSTFIKPLSTFVAGVMSRAGLTLRVGRQEIGLGSSRLVSFREGPNVRQSFDGVRLGLAPR